MGCFQCMMVAERCARAGCQRTRTRRVSNHALPPQRLLLAPRNGSFHRYHTRYNLTLPLNLFSYCTRTSHFKIYSKRRTPSRRFARRCRQTSRNVSGSARTTLAPHSRTAARHKVNTRKSAHHHFILKSYNNK